LSYIVLVGLLGDLIPKGEKSGIEAIMGKIGGEVVVKQGLEYKKSNK
jgi:hypothetical protein